MGCGVLIARDTLRPALVILIIGCEVIIVAHRLNPRLLSSTLAGGGRFRWFLTSIPSRSANYSVPGIIGTYFILSHLVHVFSSTYFVHGHVVSNATFRIAKHEIPGTYPF